MALEIDSAFARMSRLKGVAGIVIFNAISGIPIKIYNITDQVTLNLLSYLSPRIKKEGTEIINDLAKANLEMLRIHTKKHEYILCFEDDNVVVAIFNQPNENESTEEEKNAE